MSFPAAGISFFLGIERWRLSRIQQTGGEWFPASAKRPVVPDLEFCTFLAGRSALQEDLGGPIRTLADRGRTFRPLNANRVVRDLLFGAALSEGAVDCGDYACDPGFLRGRLGWPHRAQSRPQCAAARLAVDCGRPARAQETVAALGQGVLGGGDRAQPDSRRVPINWRAAEL